VGFSVPTHLSLVKQRDLEDDGPPPPPYPGQADQATPKTGERKALSDIPGRADEDTPNTSERRAPSGIPVGRWDLACSIDVKGGLLQLNSAGEPTWTPSDDTSDRAYQRDGFSIFQAPSLPSTVARVMVASPSYTWECDANSVIGELLMPRRNNVCLRSLGKHLVVFEQTVLSDDRDRPPPKPRDDPKGCLCLKIEMLSSTNIWSITGTDIYQVEGDGNDLVVQSPKYLRLWDMAKGKFRWEIFEGSGDIHRIHGFTEKYIVRTVGYWHLLERTTGRTHGDFRLPSYPAFCDLNKKYHFGAVVSTGGLFLYKPGRKALYIFRITDKQVECRMWESAEDIQCLLVLRGDLDNLELELIGQKPTWKTKSEETTPVFRNTWLKKWVMSM